MGIRLDLDKGRTATGDLLAFDLLSDPANLPHGYVVILLLLIEYIMHFTFLPMISQISCYQRGDHSQYPYHSYHT